MQRTARQAAEKEPSTAQFHASPDGYVFDSPSMVSEKPFHILNKRYMMVVSCGWLSSEPMGPTSAAQDIEVSRERSERA